MEKRWIIGLAVSSRAEGVDATLLSVEGAGMELQARPTLALHQPHPEPLRDLLLRVTGPNATHVRDVSLLHRLLGESCALAARQVADRASLSLAEVLCLGCPGHGVWHEPEGQFASTLSLGLPTIVAERTGVTTVSDFSSRDLAAGGQGAPLSALVDYLLFRHPTEHRLVLHLEAMAQVISLPASVRIAEVQGFEAVPCNDFLDLLMQQVTAGKEVRDVGGKHAVQGQCMAGLVRKWLSHPALRQRPPKSFPRYRFGAGFAAQAIQDAKQLNGRVHDLLCTATHFVARGITDSLQRFLMRAPEPDRVLVSGAGASNGLLWQLLDQSFGNGKLTRTDDVGIPSIAMPSLRSGVLAALTMDGVPASVPATTGASTSRLLGSITPGNSQNWAECLRWMASQAPAPLKAVA